MTNMVPKKFLDYSKWEHFNRSYLFVTGKLRIWDEHEANKLRESASLIKFTHTKQALLDESVLLDDILMLATHINATRVVITDHCIQWMSDADQELQNLTDMDAMKLIDSSDRYSVYDRSCVDISRRMYTAAIRAYEKQTSFLPACSQIRGIHVRDGQKWKHCTTRHVVIAQIGHAGFVARAGRMPIAVPSAEFNNRDVDDMLLAIEYCERLGRHNGWAKSVIKQLHNTIKVYKSPNIDVYKPRIKRLTGR